MSPSPSHQELVEKYTKLSESIAKDQAELNEIVQEIIRVTTPQPQSRQLYTLIADDGVLTTYLQVPLNGDSITLPGSDVDTLQVIIDSIIDATRTVGFDSILLMYTWKAIYTSKDVNPEFMKMASPYIRELAKRCCPYIVKYIEGSPVTTKGVMSDLDRLDKNVSAIVGLLLETSGVYCTTVIKVICDRFPIFATCNQ